MRQVLVTKSPHIVWSKLRVTSCHLICSLFRISNCSEIVEHYNGKEFLDNGPWVLTRTLNHLCRTSDRKLWTLEQCHGFRLQPIKEFFPVQWKDWLWYFDSTFTKDALAASENSTLIHVWNDRSKNTRVEFGTNTAYELIAEKNCPIVYSTSDYMWLLCG